jgi:hypothetical protein
VHIFPESFRRLCRSKEESQSAIRSIRRVYPTIERNPRRFVDGGWWIAIDPNYVSFARMLPNLQEIDTIKWRITCICLRNVAVYNVWAFATCFGTTDMVTESRCRRKCKWKWFSIIQVLVGSRGSDSPCCDANDSLHDSTRYKLVKWSSCNFLPRKIKHLLSL